MRRNPQSDWKIADVESLCREFDMSCMPVTGGGSHYKVGHAKMQMKLTIPFKQPHKSCIYQKFDTVCGFIEQINMNISGYAIIVEPLSAEDGGGFVATVPDLPGCISDGETPQEAFANVEDAIKAWIEAAKDLGHNVPQPTRRFAMTA